MAPELMLLFGFGLVLVRLDPPQLPIFRDLKESHVRVEFSFAIPRILFTRLFIQLLTSYLAVNSISKHIAILYSPSNLLNEYQR